MSTPDEASDWFERAGSERISAFLQKSFGKAVGLSPQVRSFLYVLNFRIFSGLGKRLSAACRNLDFGIRQLS